MESKTNTCLEANVRELAPRERPQLAYLQVTVPSEMAAAVKRHHAALSRFAANMSAAGIGQDITAHSIAALVDSYRTELAASVVIYRERFDGR